LTQAHSPEVVWALLKDGYVYLDVRSELEFVDGHVPGAVNVPLLGEGRFGSRVDERFVEKVCACLSKAERIVVGCQSGLRSKLALELLLTAGFADVVEMPAGYAGCRDAFGRLSPGWVKCGLPTEMGAQCLRAPATRA